MPYFAWKLLVNYEKLHWRKNDPPPKNRPGPLPNRLFQLSLPPPGIPPRRRRRRRGGGGGGGGGKASSTTDGHGEGTRALLLLLLSLLPSASSARLGIKRSAAPFGVIHRLASHLSANQHERPGKRKEKKCQSSIWAWKEIVLEKSVLKRVLQRKKKSA